MLAVAKTAAKAAWFRLFLVAEVRAMVKTLIYCLENYGGRDVMCVMFFLAFY